MLLSSTATPLFIAHTVYTRHFPSKEPFGNPALTYCAAKVLALNATHVFIIDKKLHFTVINFCPGYVIGKSELLRKTEE